MTPGAFNQPGRPVPSSQVIRWLQLPVDVLNPGLSVGVQLATPDSE
jgi:hypothetical protein